MDTAWQVFSMVLVSMMTERHWLLDLHIKVTDWHDEFHIWLSCAKKWWQSFQNVKNLTEPPNCRHWSEIVVISSLNIGGSPFISYRPLFLDSSENIRSWKFVCIHPYKSYSGKGVNVRENFPSCTISLHIISKRLLYDWKTLWIVHMNQSPKYCLSF